MPDICTSIRTLVRSTAAAAIGVLVLSGPASAASPPIRTGASNAVPACVTPDQLMRFLKTRNGALDPRFKDIATHYKRHGEAWRVRWDYAFFQMAIETNFLTYRAPSGRMGDVDPSQFNFAGIGTTGGGVPGDRFPDVSTGVLGQIQHLVVYSGERIQQPVAPRTRLKQDDILALSAPIAATRPVTFQDLSGRWAVDKAYGRSIEWVADRFRSQFCSRPAVPVRGAGLDPALPAVGDVPAAGPPTQKALPARQRPRAAAGPGLGESGGKSGLQGPDLSSARAPARDLSTTVETERGIGISPPATPIYQGLGAEIARRSIAEQRAAETDGMSRLGALSPAVELRANPSQGSCETDAVTCARTSVSAGPSTILPPTCQLYAASYGGERTAVIRSESKGELRLTLLTVLDGFEQSLTERYVATLPPGSRSLGVYDTPAVAEAQAIKECEAAGRR